MRMVIKFVLYALVVILLVSWLTTVIRSCGEEKPAADPVENPLNEAISDEAAAEDELVNDILESVESTETETSGESGGNSPQITSIDYSKSLDKDEEAMLDQLAKEKQQEAPKEKTPAAPAPKPSTSTSSSGNYFVITGSFGEEGNAKKQQQKLKSLGYSSAEVVQFDGSKLFTVISGRYASNAAASKVVDELKSRHKVDCYVKKKEL